MLWCILLSNCLSNVLYESRVLVCLFTDGCYSSSNSSSIRLLLLLQHTVCLCQWNEASPTAWVGVGAGQLSSVCLQFPAGVAPARRPRSDRPTDRPRDSKPIGRFMDNLPLLPYYCVNHESDRQQQQGPLETLLF
jgi:hypothetical protein